MEQEIWKAIKDYEGLYEVSNQGRVRSIDRIVKRDAPQIKSKIMKRKGKILYLAKACNHVKSIGYNVKLSKEGKGKDFHVHRLVAQAFIPNPDNKPQINHKDCNESNNNVNNLEWVTASENIKWSYDVGGFNNKLKSQRKFTDFQIREIRHKYLSKQKNNTELTKEYNFNTGGISRIVNYKIYRNEIGENNTAYPDL